MHTHGFVQKSMIKYNITSVNNRMLVLKDIR